MKDQIIFDDRYRYLDGCVKAFVRGKKPLSWILPKIRRNYHGFYPKFAVLMPKKLSAYLIQTV